MRSAYLTAESIAEALTTKRIGSQICFYEEISSTNSEAKRLAMEDCPDGTLVIADEQHGGRGRLSRSFLSPKGGGLWFTLVLRPDIAPTEASKCTLLGFGKYTLVSQPSGRWIAYESTGSSNGL